MNQLYAGYRAQCRNSESWTPHRQKAEEARRNGSGYPSYPVRNAVIRQVIDYLKELYERYNMISVSQHVYMNHIYLSRLIRKRPGEFPRYDPHQMRKPADASDPDWKTYEVAEK